MSEATKRVIYAFILRMTILTLFLKFLFVGKQRFNFFYFRFERTKLIVGVESFQTS